MESFAIKSFEGNCDGGKEVLETGQHDTAEEVDFSSK